MEKISTVLSRCSHRIYTPQIVYPFPGSLNVTNIVASNYRTCRNFLGNHTSSDWEASYSRDFHVVVANLLNTTEFKTELPLDELGLISYTQYYVRVRYRSGDFVSFWSDPIPIITGFINKNAEIQYVEWIPDDEPLQENTNYVVKIHAIDPENDPITYALELESVCGDINITQLSNPETFLVSLGNFGNALNDVVFRYKVKDDNHTEYNALTEHKTIQGTHPVPEILGYTIDPDTSILSQNSTYTITIEAQGGTGSSADFTYNLEPCDSTFIHVESVNGNQITFSTTEKSGICNSKITVTDTTGVCSHIEIYFQINENAYITGYTFTPDIGVFTSNSMYDLKIDAIDPENGTILYDVICSGDCENTTINQDTTDPSIFHIHIGQYTSAPHYTIQLHLRVKDQISSSYNEVVVEKKIVSDPSIPVIVSVENPDTEILENNKTYVVKLNIYNQDNVNFTPQVSVSGSVSSLSTQIDTYNLTAVYVDLITASGNYGGSVDVTYSIVDSDNSTVYDTTTQTYRVNKNPELDCTQGIEWFPDDNPLFTNKTYTVRLNPSDPDSTYNLDSLIECDKQDITLTQNDALEWSITTSSQVHYDNPVNFTFTVTDGYGGSVSCIQTKQVQYTDVVIRSVTWIPSISTKMKSNTTYIARLCVQALSSSVTTTLDVSGNDNNAIVSYDSSATGDSTCEDGVYYREFQITTTNSYVGDSQVTFTFIAQEGSHSDNYTITYPVNYVPIINSLTIQPLRTLDNQIYLIQGENYQVSLNATDSDNDTIFYDIDTSTRFFTTDGGSFSHEAPDSNQFLISFDSGVEEDFSTELHFISFDEYTNGNEYVYQFTPICTSVVVKNIKFFTTDGTCTETTLPLDTFKEYECCIEYHNLFQLNAEIDSITVVDPDVCEVELLQSPQCSSNCTGIVSWLKIKPGTHADGNSTTVTVYYHYDTNGGTSVSKSVSFLVSYIDACATPSTEIIFSSVNSIEYQDIDVTVNRTDTYSSECYTKLIDLSCSTGCIGRDGSLLISEISNSTESKSFQVTFPDYDNKPGNYQTVQLQGTVISSVNESSSNTGTVKVYPEIFPICAVSLPEGIILKSLNISKQNSDSNKYLILGAGESQESNSSVYTLSVIYNYDQEISDTDPTTTGSFSDFVYAIFSTDSISGGYNSFKVFNSDTSFISSNTYYFSGSCIDNDEDLCPSIYKIVFDNTNLTIQSMSITFRVYQNTNSIFRGSFYNSKYEESDSLYTLLGFSAGELYVRYSVIAYGTSTDFSSYKYVFFNLSNSGSNFYPQSLEKINNTYYVVGYITDSSNNTYFAYATGSYDSGEMNIQAVYQTSIVCDRDFPIILINGTAIFTSNDSVYFFVLGDNPTAYSLKINSNNTTCTSAVLFEDSSTYVISGTYIQTSEKSFVVGVSVNSGSISSLRLSTSDLVDTKVLDCKVPSKHFNYVLDHILLGGLLQSDRSTLVITGILDVNRELPDSMMCKTESNCNLDVKFSVITEQITFTEDTSFTLTNVLNLVDHASPVDYSYVVVLKNAVDLCNGTEYL